MGLTQHFIDALDLYLDSNLDGSLIPCSLNIVRDLVNLCLGLGMSHIDTKEQSNEKSKVFLQLLYGNKGTDKISIPRFCALVR